MSENVEKYIELSKQQLKLNKQLENITNQINKIWNEISQIEIIEINEKIKEIQLLEYLDKQNV